MSWSITVMGEDRRQTWMAKALAEAGCRVAAYGVPDWEDGSAALAEAAAASRILALPMPAADKGGLLRLAGGRSMPLEDLWPLLPAGVRVFGGRLPEDIPPEIHAVDYGKSESVAILNAVPTAEGAIQKAMELLPVTLWQSRCLVIGFGRIGKLLAQRLQGLGASVTVAARKPADHALAAAMGFACDQTGVYIHGLGDYDCIFNTVPVLVLPESQLRRTRPDCLLIDLASQPGGLDFAACARLPRQAVHALSLPGQVAPATAGRILSDFILEQLE